jgi:hypothetical protein
MEIRAKKGNRRKKIMASHRAAYTTAIERVMKIEVKGLRDALSRYLGLRDRVIFDDVQRRRYEELKETIKRLMGPVYQSMRLAIEADVESETDQDIAVTELDRHVEKYIEGYANRFVGRSQALVKKWLQEEGWAEKIDAHIADYQGVTPGKDAMWETVRSGNAFLRAALVAAGVATITWVASANACPLCQAMHGRTVGARDYFAAQGQEMNWGDDTYKPDKMIGHPPLHGGCACTIS